MTIHPESPAAIEKAIINIVDAFVNNNITKGHLKNPSANIIVQGNTIYEDVSSSVSPEFVQTAIRLPDDIFILNSYMDAPGSLTTMVEAAITSIRGKYVYIRLARVNHKTNNGTVDPKLLRATISNCNNSPAAHHIQKALKTYGRDRMQEEAIENLCQLQISIELMDNKRIYSDICIRTVVKELVRAKKVCRMVDKYLDVLKQFPEPEP